MAKVLETRDGLGEVSIETGFGMIVGYEPKGRNAAVRINAEHLDLVVSSWLDTANIELAALAQRAHEEGRRVGYRIVVHRKRTQPTDVPLEQIPNLQRVRDLEHLELVSGAGAAVEGPPPAAPTVNQEEAAPTPAPPAAPAPGASAPAGPICSLCGGALAGHAARKVAGDLQHVECPGLEELTAPPVREEGEAGTLTTGSVPTPPDPDPTPPPATRRPTPKVQEAKPWEFFNTDGSINPGSYAYGAAAGMVLLAWDLSVAKARGEQSESGKFVAPPRAQLQGLARRLLQAADLAQSALRDDMRVDRMAGSHTRCRAAIRAALDLYPVPWGQPVEVQERWVQDLAAASADILAVTVALLDPEASR